MLRESYILTINRISIQAPKVTGRIWIYFANHLALIARVISQEKCVQREEYPFKTRLPCMQRSLKTVCPSSILNNKYIARWKILILVVFQHNFFYVSLHLEGGLLASWIGGAALWDNELIDIEIERNRVLILRRLKMCLSVPPFRSEWHLNSPTWQGHFWWLMAHEIIE